jgi:hypothetical protein
VTQQLISYHSTTPLLGTDLEVPLAHDFVDIAGTASPLILSEFRLVEPLVKMVLAKSKNAVGLGNTLMNDRFGKGKGADRKKATGIHRINHATGETVSSCWTTL